METFEKKDTATRDRRSFGTDKRLVIASRSVAPVFKILLFPHRAGEPLSVTTWNAERTQLTIEIAGRKDTITFARSTNGRTLLTLDRAGQPTLSLP